jgi:hypothetical protein
MEEPIVTEVVFDANKERAAMKALLDRSGVTEEFLADVRAMRKIIEEAKRKTLVNEGN